MATSNTPLLIEGPKAEIEPNATDGAPILELQASESTSAEETAAPETAAPELKSRWNLPTYAPIAAAIAFSLALGAIAGAATSTLLRDPSPEPVTAEATRTLQSSVTQLGSEL